MLEQKRADARRNYERVLAVAEEQVAAHGSSASLEQIARIAEVGSATVRRHFPTRQALLEAVSHKRIEALCARAHDLTGAGDGRSALLEWLTEVVAYCVRARGLAVALSYDDTESGPYHNACSVALEEAGNPLLRRAIGEGTVAEDVTVSELISLIVGIALATEHHPDAAAKAQRLFRLSVAGLNPQDMPQN
ncbi:TetR/AcrR family transcriptional regulator [Nocardia sp. NPDC005978]|uniref:TetR/AcrR family transcriptional regulator n=1 Tax=Nocardia sp. NPDC005978 TaxID=3156725 RepID=UPI0033BA3ACD